ncbi:MAG TPA: ATP-binding protein [Nocardioides sp.]|uniref:sensor histidine kinase n=1 Tax=Nocardioides sp. TaxID=35761 RepID=UPI002CAF2237|nr:ATP-binding protein [Nocardioides sp.]HTW17716.1 ATP-binding protein [Nocardioides sp.]
MAIAGDASLFRKLVDAAPDATVIVDSEATIVLSNRQMLNVFGWSGDDLVGKPIEMLVPERFRPSHPALRGGFVRQPSVRPIGAVEVYALHRDGREIPVEISLSPLETDQGLLVSAAIRDLTERRRIQAEADRMRDELIATVSHELRTPLTSIIGYTELLADLGPDELGPTARSLVAVIERNAAREMRLIDDLLTMAFLDGDRMDVAREPTDLVELARRVVTDQRTAAVEAGLALVLDVEEVRPVPGDFHRLVQVLENLLTNAFKFTPSGGEVRVRVREEEGNVVLEVADTGVGLREEETRQIFERLYRTPSAVAAHAQGAGLGLSIVRKIVDAHAGEIQVESVLGVGTTFRVVLPYLDVSSSDRTSTTAAGSSAP